MNAEELRSLIRDMLPWFDDTLRARFANELVDRAARNRTGWVPESPDDTTVREIEAFVAAAKRAGYADPTQVDAYLRAGSNAFLAKNYPAAFRIFRSLLMAVGHGHVDMGQEELIDDVLGVDSATCAAQYVLSMYITATPKSRGKAVLSAIPSMFSSRTDASTWSPRGSTSRSGLGSGALWVDVASGRFRLLERLPPRRQVRALCRAKPPTSRAATGGRP